MFTQSIWNAYGVQQDFFELKKDIEVEVAIVGGGITGITTAMLLKEQGREVAVFEAREVGKGTSSHSTGNLYSITDELLSPLKSKYDIDTVREVVEARKSAAGLIEQSIVKYKIDCDYKKQPLYLFNTDDKKDIGQEREIARDAGLEILSLPDDFPVEAKEGFSIQGQAQFNPLLYIQGLAAEIEGGNCNIYENTRVRKIEEKEGHYLLHTTSGVVRAKYVVQATHTPKGVELQYHTVLGPYREYGIAAKLDNDNYPEGIFWGYFNGDKYSFRSYTRNGESYLLCVGRPHKVGQAVDNREHIKELTSFAQNHFAIKEIICKWGGQNYKPADLLPYIGRKTSNSKELLATGFSTDGLVYGTLSAIINTDIIVGKENRWEEMFKASRHQPGKAAGKFAKENLDVASQMLKDWLFKGEDAELSSIQPGESKVLVRDNKKVAVHRTTSGELKAFSAVCTHMGCVVNWNNAEKSWDCPCHGTRFDMDGEVLEGPAFEPLPRIKE
ncbi:MULTISPECIES: FAD-dependent oxidoreductase [Antarcticibacterium]|nr:MULTISPECIES: FAD-dependent oxidoreductase [Antarcticibacterium]